MSELWGDFEKIVCRELTYLLSSQENAVFIALSDNAVHGCTMITPGPVAVLHALGISTAFRGQALSRRLIACAVAWARDRDNTRAIMTFVEYRDGDQKRRLKRLGFVEDRSLRGPGSHSPMFLR
jgi:GNAT superfamily N-acetyltransferase